MNAKEPQRPPYPARSYGREKPKAESGQGRLTNNAATPTDAPDRIAEAVPQQSLRQVNAEDVVNQRARATDPPDASGEPLPPQPDHSMKEEEPTGWDMAPTDIHDPRRQRHPRTEGKGGTP